MAPSKTAAKHPTRTLDQLRAENALLTEREQAALRRVTELSEVNRLLIESSVRLTSDADPEAFLESLMRTMAEQIDAVIMGLFEHDAQANTLTLRIMFQNGVFRRGPSGAEVPLFAGPFPTDITAAWDTAVRNGGMLYAQPRFPDVDKTYWPGCVEWFKRMSVSEAALMVLSIGNEPMGCLGISWKAGQKLLIEDCPQIEALAQQAAAALRLVRLSDQARDAAVAREQEKAARERAAELARANDVLQRSTKLLIQHPDPGTCLESVLLDAAAASGAVGAGIMGYDASADTLQMTAWVRYGVRLDLDTDPRMVVWRNPFPSSVMPAWNRVSNDQVLWVDMNVTKLAWREAEEWHRSMGHRNIMVIPLLVSGKPLGFLSLCFEELVPPTQSHIDQARTLAAHAALALQLTSLAKEVRREAATAAAMAERNRIARDLHDTLAQGFTGILAQLGVIEGVLAAQGSPSDVAVAHAVERAATLARSSLAEARRSVGMLRYATAGKEQIPQPGISIGLRTLFARMVSGTGLKVSLDIKPAKLSLLPTVEEVLRRIAQETLTNTLKHAGKSATKFRIKMRCRVGRVNLTIEDDGCGFDASTDKPINEGYGLEGMRERVLLAGGTMQLFSRPGEGVKIIIELPITFPTVK